MTHNEHARIGCEFYTPTRFENDIDKLFILTCDITGMFKDAAILACVVHLQANPIKTSTRFSMNFVISLIDNSSLHFVSAQMRLRWCSGNKFGSLLIFSRTTVIPDAKYFPAA